MSRNAALRFHGRPVSWVAVSFIIVGFLPAGWRWYSGRPGWLFWAGAGVAVLGGLLALATGIFDDWY